MDNLNMESSHCFTCLTPLTFLERSGRCYPDKPALIIADKTLTFGDLLKSSRGLAAFLRDVGVSHGDCVGLLAHNSQLVIEAHYGIPAAGAVIVALNPWLPIEDIARQIKYSEASVLLVNESTYSLARNVCELLDVKILLVIDDGDEVESFCKNTCVLNRNGAVNYPDIALDASITNENSPIAINFTSGTTGNPKGVMYSHRAAYVHAIGQVLMLGLNSQSKYFWSLPMFHVNGWGHMWATVAVSSIQVVDHFSAGLNYQGLSRRVFDAGATHMAGAPRVLRNMIGPEHVEIELKGLTVVTGGAAPTQDLIKFSLMQGVNLIHQYGLSETCGPFVVCEPSQDWNAQSLDQQSLNRLRQGLPAIHAGTGVRVIDDTFTDVPWDGDTLGEVIMRGNSVAIGYYKDPIATDKTFKNGWFHSGDMAVVHPDGYIEIRDRIKDLIFIETTYGWENVSSMEIENVVVQFPGINDASVISFGDNDNKIIAFYEKAPGVVVDHKEIDLFCRQRLADFKVPKYFIERELPKTSTGKVKKNLLMLDIDKFIQVH